MTRIGPEATFSVDYTDNERVIFDGTRMVGEGVMCAFRHCIFIGRAADDMRTIIREGGPSLTDCDFR